MSLARRIVKHTLVQVISRLLGNIIGIIVIGILTRYLGKEGFGNYTTILAYIFFFGALSDLGLYLICVNEINKAGLDRSRFYSAVYSLRFFTGLILMIIAGIIIWAFPYPLVVKLGVLIISLSIFFSLLDQIQIAFYQAEMKMVRVSIAEIASKIILAAGVIVGIALGVDLLTLLWAVVAGHGMQFFINLSGLVKRIKLRLNFDLEYWRQIINKTWPVAVSQIFVLIYFKMDTIFLSLLRPQAVAQIEVGIYGAPYKVLEVLIALVPLFMGLIAPILSHAWSHKLMDKLREMYQKTFDALSIITWPLILGGIVLARPIMNLIAPGFQQSDRILQLLIIATGIIFLAHLPTYMIVTLGEQKKMLKSYALAAVLAIILYIVLIPVYSFYAAAVITIFIELLILIMAWQRVKKITKQKINWLIFAKAGISALIMSSVLILLKDWNLFILLAVGMITYLVIMVLIRGISKEVIKDLLFAKQTG